jgi:hypothetical protein
MFTLRGFRPIWTIDPRNLNDLMALIAADIREMGAVLARSPVYPDSQRPVTGLL